MYHLGIDLGGTNIATAVVDENYKILGRGKLKTRCPRPAEEIIADMAQAAKMAVSDAGLTLKDISTVGVGSPGAINSKDGINVTSNNLKFENDDLRGILRKYLGFDAYIDNDASAAAYGEFLAGAGKGTKNFIAITLGTGVGSGIIIDGKVYSGTYSGGGELGHTVIVVDGDACTCGRKGCWEAYASATGLIRQTKEKMLECKDSMMWPLCENDINKVNGRTAYDAKRKGDQAATEVIHAYEKYVACGITNAINTFEPEVLCIGGGISKEGDNILLPIIEHVKKDRFAKNAEKDTIIKIAELGNDAGIIGAAFLHQLHKQ